MSVPIRPAGISNKAAILMYGDPGTQKTRTLASGAPDLKTLIIRPPMDHVDSVVGSGAMEAVVRDWEDTWDVRDQLRHAEPDEWDVVGLDSISLFQDIGLHDVLQATYDRAGPAGSAGRKHRMQFGADKGEYNVNAIRIAELVRDLVGMEAFHVVVTAHPFWGKRLKTDEEDEGETDDLQIQPWIQVKGMVSKICGYMNIVGYMEVAERKRGNKVVTYPRMRTEGGPLYYAKNQFYLPDGERVFGEGGVIVNPTMPKILEAISKAKGRTQPSGRRPVSRRPTGRRPTGRKR